MEYLIAQITFSAFAGFAVGHFLRLLIKVLLIISGFALVIVFSLNYYGVIDGVNYDAIANGFNAFSAVVSSEASNIIEFAKKSVPGAIGFASGLSYSFFRARR